MAKYKRQKVKHYHRSFYSREMRVKRGIGIAVLVVAVLAAAWFAAPHVLDWATHTWYTVVKDRDLEAESASRAEAAASSAAASSAARQTMPAAGRAAGKTRTRKTARTGSTRQAARAPRSKALPGGKCAKSAR